MLHPSNMQEHAPARSLLEYLEYLRGELAGDPGPARAHDLRARIRAIEDEINARSAA